ncbi:ATP-dependent zinc metalloprotease FtsH [bacterium]|nr:ATP-dependent zinc metalloprotease FtsH [bacterium]
MKSNRVFLWLLLAVLFFLVFQSFENFSQEKPLELSYSDFRKSVRAGHVKSIEVGQERLKGQFFSKKENESISSEIDEKIFTSNWFGEADELVQFLEENAVEDIKLESFSRQGFLRNILLWTVPFIFGFILLLFLLRQVQSGNGKAMSFGKSKIRIADPKKTRVTFADVAGVEEAKEELEEVIDFLKSPKKYTVLGAKIPKGVMLVGAPGTGKTLLAKAVAGEAHVPFLTISGSDFVEMFVGVGASRVRDLFEQAKKSAPCIVFVDEIDAVGRKRGAGLGGGHDEREQTLNQLLVEMDGFEDNNGIIMMAATNRPDVLDSALLRPGRFDRQVIVSRPDLKGREGILRVHTKNTPLNEDVDLNTLARATSGFTGADIHNLVNEAALMAAKQGLKTITMDCFEEAKDKVILGKERKTTIMNEHDKKLTSYHEAGHALVAKLLPDTDPVHKVTIIPRGMALGVTHQMPTEDRYTLSQNQAESSIAILMGGRLAEEIVFKMKCNGASNDIEKATELARRMVCEWGMSSILGPIAFGQNDQEIFLAKEVGHQSNYSEKTAQQVDAEIKKIIDRNYKKAKDLLQKNRKTLDKIALTLLEKETLSGKDLDVLMAGQELSKA